MKGICRTLFLAAFIALPAQALDLTQARTKVVSIYSDSAVSQRFDKRYAKAAYQLGEYLAARSELVVLNGHTTSLAGDVMRGVLDNKGKVEWVTDEAAYQAECAASDPCRKATLQITPAGQDQKLYLRDKGDILIIMPGGWEALSAAASFADYQTNPAYDEQIADAGIVSNPQPVKFGIQPKKEKTDFIKPIVFFNMNHYWDNLHNQIVEMQRQEMLPPAQLKYIGFADKPKDVGRVVEGLIKSQRR